MAQFNRKTSAEDAIVAGKDGPLRPQQVALGASNHNGCRQLALSAKGLALRFRVLRLSSG
jgi:hypothetical protein